MTNDEISIARMMIKVQILERDGDAFEKLFTQIMSASNPNFQQVKPQGKFGDRKNDGFDKNEGVYYQVYAPENSKISLSNTINKLNTDFAGLKQYWDTIRKIETFYFVLNDKYKGVYPTLISELTKLEKTHTSIKFRLLTAKELEEIFVKLPLDKIQNIIGFIPQKQIGLINLGIMSNVVKHLISNWKVPSSVEKLVNPDYEEKIIFNALNDYVGTLLKLANYQASVVDGYFTHKPEEKTILKEIFVRIYEEAKKIQLSPNEIFFYILNKSNPSNVIDKEISDAIIVLMSIYFEACDIFEEPKGKI